MHGELIWWSAERLHGIISVMEHDRSIRYFLLASGIASAPAVVHSGQFVKFTKALTPTKEGLLPLAVGVLISDEAFAPEPKVGTNVTGAAILLTGGGDERS